MSVPEKLKIRLTSAIALAAILLATWSVAFAQTDRLPLRPINDLPLTGTASRLDYQIFVATSRMFLLSILNSSGSKFLPKAAF